MPSTVIGTEEERTRIPGGSRRGQPPRPPFRGWLRRLLPAGLVLAAVLLGRGLTIQPILTAAFVVGVGLLVLGALEGPLLQRLFGGGLVIVLAGYALLGRGFAYMGVQPVFVGEIVLVLGLAAFVPSSDLRYAFRSRITWLLVAFAGWCALQTLPYVGQYGADALRDAVLWGYALFALLVAALVLRHNAFERVIRLYGRFVPWLFLWLPIGFLVGRVYWALIPRTPGSDIPLINLKPGDTLVHLAGGAAFVMLGLHRANPSEKRGKEWLWWVIWLAGFVVSASYGRGGMLAAVTALTLVIFLMPGRLWLRAVWRPVAVAVVLFALLLTLRVEVDLGSARVISAEQVVENALSIVGENRAANLESTARWREDWWGDIVGYTFGGRYFWTGKGFGVNLEVDDGHVTTADLSSRNPHSVHFAVLARTGVPGLALWVALQVVFGLSLLQMYRRALSNGDLRSASFNLWILAFWVAFLINGSFDTFIEGPQGGIWFWSVFGLGIAAVRAQRQRPARSASRHARAVAGAS